MSLEKITSYNLPESTFDSMRNFAGALIVDRSIFRSWKLFYLPQEKQSLDVFRCLDQKYFKRFHPQAWTDFDIELPIGIMREFFRTDTIHMVLPTLEASDNILDVTEHFLTNMLWPMAAWWAIDDLFYTIMKSFIRMFGIFCNLDKWICWFGTQQYKKYLFEQWKLTEFSVQWYSLEWVLQAEIDQWYINKTIWDPNRSYAYSHLLRAHAEFRLFTWAKEFLVHAAKYNILATSRGNGKTFLAIEEVGKELLKEDKWFWGRKTKMIRLFVPDKEEIGDQAITYLEEIMWDLVDFKLPNGKKAVEISRSKYSAVCNITGHRFKLTTLKNFWAWLKKEEGTAKGEGIACDIAIIDEAARIPNEFWQAFHQRAAFETQKFIIISTINRETQANHWFYELLVRAETGDLKNSNAMRVTIDENEAMKVGLTDEQWREAIEEAKKTLRSAWDREFYSKWYCIILDESNVFDLSWAITVAEKANDDDPRIIWFDLAKLDDAAGIVIINLKTRTIERATAHNNSTYSMQLENVKQLKAKYRNSLVIWDRSWVGEVVAEQDTLWIVDAWIKSTATWDLKYNSQMRYWTASKWYIVNTLALAFETHLINISDECSELIKQLKDFIKMKSPHWEVVLYKWRGKWKDDLVLAAAYAVVYIYGIMQAKSVKDIEMLMHNYFETWQTSYNSNEENNSSDDGYHNTLY